MPNINVYTDIAKPYATGYAHGYYQGYAIGVVDTITKEIVERTSQTVSESSYLPVAKINQERIDFIMENYELIDENDVISFIHEKPSILKLVNDTYTKLHEFIPTVNRITLEVLFDPEDDQKNLVAKIHSNLPIDAVLDKLDEFDQQWFASKFIESDMLFNVSIDCE